MPHKAAKIVLTLVISLILLEVVGPAFIGSDGSEQFPVSFHVKKPSTSVFELFLAEKAEEESEKTEEEKGRADRPVLIDFSCIAQSLSTYFIPKFHFSAYAFQYDIRPPVYTLNCVFII